MRILRQLTIALLAAAPCFVANAQAQDNPHRTAAAAFNDANQYPDASFPVKQLAERLMLETQAPQEQRPEFERLANEVLSSPEFRESRILAYMRVFSEPELRLLLELVQHPAFHLYIRKAATIQSVSGQALVETMAAKWEDLATRYGHILKAPSAK